MNLAELIDETVSSEEELVQLQLQIARRADELARSRGRDGGTADRDCWLEAEQQVISRLEPAMA